MLTPQECRIEFIKTDKSTNVYFKNGKYEFTDTKPIIKESKSLYGVHIYITSLNQKIDGGDYFIIGDGGDYWMCAVGLKPIGFNPRKIIATTNNNSLVHMIPKITDNDIRKIISLKNTDINNNMIYVTHNKFLDEVVPKSYGGFIECVLPPIMPPISSEPNTKHVAIITNSKEQYHNWLKKNKQSDTNYYFVRSINDCDGREFHKVELIHGSEKIKDLSEIIDHIGQFCSIEEEDEKDYVYEATYNGCIHESSWCTISIHKTKPGAIKAMNEHKYEEYKKFLKYNEECLKSDPNFFKEFTNKFGEHQDWRIKRTELKE